MTTTKLYRQGDVLLIPCHRQSRPQGATEEPIPADGRVVLAYGEVTGHAHVLAAAAAVALRTASERYIEVREQTDLTHEEHAPITLKPGLYRVVLQREYTPATIRQVMD